LEWAHLKYKSEALPVLPSPPDLNQYLPPSQVHVKFANKVNSSDSSPSNVAMDWICSVGGEKIYINF
jgi:hypothetical protein